MTRISTIATRKPLLFFVAALLIYAASTNRVGILGHISQSPRVHYIYLAESFLHGRLDLAVTEAEVRQLTELVPYEGKYYVVYPPVPAVLLMPFVPAFGKSFRTGILSIFLAAASVAITYIVLRRCGIPVQVSVWVTVLFGFGTSFWYTALNGSSWYLAHITGVFFLLVALVEAYGKRRPFIIGASIGAAMLSRLPILLATPFFLYLLLRGGKANIPKACAMLFTVGCFCGLNMLYNWSRYGTLLDVGYYMIPGVLDEPWYQNGIFNIRYVPRNIYALLFEPPVLIGRFPYIVPSLFGLSLIFTTPALLLIFEGRADAFTWALAFTVLLVSVPGLLHGWPGASQFGYRFSLDYTPFLMLLTAKGIGDGLSLKARALILLSVCISLWGLRYAASYEPAWLFRSLSANGTTRR